MEPFSPIKGISQQLSPIQSLSETRQEEETNPIGKKYSFGNIMASQLRGVNNTLNESTEQKEKLMKGELKNTHDLAIAGMKSGILLRLTTGICSKVSSACTTLFQMQI